MKHVKIAAVIMAAAVIVAAAVFLTATLISSNNEKAKKEADEKLIIFSFDSDDIDRFDIENEAGKFSAELSRSIGYWTLSEDYGFDLNDVSIANAVSYMSNLKAVSILDSTDYSKYGFDDPIKLTAYNSGESYTLLVGDPSPTNEYFYVMKEGDDQIYLVEYKTGIILELNKNSLKSIYPYSFSTYDIESFTLWKGAEKDENILFSMQKNEDESWKMVKPFEDDSVYMSTVDQYLTAAIKDQINNFIKEDCDSSEYSKYGFDDPSYVFEVNTKDTTRKVIFGKDTEDGKSTYALYLNGDVVTFEKNTATVLGKTTIDMMDPTIFSPEKEDLKTVEITSGSLTKTLDMTSDIFKADSSIDITDDSSETDDGPDIKTDHIVFFNSFNNMIGEAVEKDASPGQDIILSVKYTMKDGSETLIEYAKSDGKYYALKNGKYTGFTVDEDSIQNVIDKLSEIIENYK